MCMFVCVYVCGAPKHVFDVGARCIQRQHVGVEMHGPCDTKHIIIIITLHMLLFHRQPSIPPPPAATRRLIHQTATLLLESDVEARLEATGLAAAAWWRNRCGTM